MDFYTGKILNIDLTRGEATVDSLRMHLGREVHWRESLLLRYLWDQAPAGVILGRPRIR